MDPRGLSLRPRKLLLPPDDLLAPPLPGAWAPAMLPPQVRRILEAPARDLPWTLLGTVSPIPAQLSVG